MANKRQKFIEIAERRVAKAMKDLQLIGNLANKRTYDFEEDDVKKIFRTLQSELDTAKKRFEMTSDNPIRVFKL
jgi:hypothetical protein